MTQRVHTGTAQGGGAISIVSVASGGTQVLGNSGLEGLSISADGRYVAFESSANTLVAGDTNALADIFVHDRQTLQTTRVSASSTGAQANGSSSKPVISATGRYIAFWSSATNLVAGDSNGVEDVFVHDQATGMTARISVSSDGTQGNGTPGGCAPALSADGRFVAYSSYASNLVENDTNGQADVFVYDQVVEDVRRVSVHSNGAQGSWLGSSYCPAISSDGRYVAFISGADNLIGTDTNGDGWCDVGCDRNNALDVFVHDTATRQTTRVSIATGGAEANLGSVKPSISADGRYVAFQSLASNLVQGDTNNRGDIFVHDRQTSQTTRVSVASDGVQANDTSSWPSINGDGRFVAFSSRATNLVSDDAGGWEDAFIHDRWTGQTARITESSTGANANQHSYQPAFDSTGRYVAFVSAARNLIGNYAGNGYNVYLYDRGPEVDLSIDAVLPIQVLEGQDLVKDKATGVKVVVRKDGPGPVDNVSVRLNYGASTYTVFYVYQAVNVNAQHALMAGNHFFPLSLAANEVTKTVYFFSDSLVPTGTTYQVSATVDYLGTFAETNETNNTATSRSIRVYDTQWPRGPISPTLSIRFLPVDWDASLSSFTTYYESSTDFLGGVFPVSEPRFTPYKSTQVISTQPYRGDDGRLSEDQLRNWLRDLSIQEHLANPLVDRIVATVPVGWFRSRTRDFPDTGGLAFRSMMDAVIVMSGQSELPNGDSEGTLAHEIGHSYGLRLQCEEYDPLPTDLCLPLEERLHGIGKAAAPGLWVEKRIPIEVTGNHIDGTNHRDVYCFMGASADEFWVDVDDYGKLLNDQRVDAATSATSPASTRAILAAGTISITGTATLDNWYLLPEAELSPLIPGPYSFEYQNASGGVLAQRSFDVLFTVEGKGLTGTITVTNAPFVLAIPYVSGTAKIAVKQGGVQIAQKMVSANAPTVTVLSPNGGERISGQTTVRWSGSDSDGDTLSYAVLYSNDNGANWETLAINVGATSYAWDVTELSAGNRYLVKVIATDGFNAAQDTSDAIFGVWDRVYLPLVVK
ncbi:MAG: PD40 domain-containing protein [Chloroflexi bacterium]|nr:PD40 domain-containing protein [Chloroflexota bacterium]